MKTGGTRALAALAALTLCFAALPAMAQQTPQIEGAWLENGALGTSLVYLSSYGNYLAWHSWQQFVESGTYTADGSTLTLHQFEGASTQWEYTLGEYSLSAFNRPSGVSMNMRRFALAVPEALLGYWEGIDEEYGEFELYFADNSEFDELYFDDFNYLWGIFIANDSTIALGYTDGSIFQATYQILGTDWDAVLNLYNPQTGAFLFSMTRHVPEPSPDVSPTPAPTDAPLVSIAPLVTPQPRAELPAGMVGAWAGTDDEGAHVLTIDGDGAFTVAYLDPARADKNAAGTIRVQGDTLELTMEDGSTDTLRFILMGDSLLLADAGLANAVTYARAQNPVIVTDAPVLPTDAPSGLADPAWVGTWAGIHSGEYFELTVRDDGSYDYLTLPDEGMSHSGQATAENGQLTLTFPGGITQYAYTWDGGAPVIGDNNKLVRLPGPLAREPLPAAAGTAGALRGVWGGMRGGAYEEHAFLPDGTYRHFVFLPEPAVHDGNYIAGDGSVAMLTMGGAKTAAFTANESGALTLTFSGEEPAEYVRKDGTVTRPAP